MRPVNSSVRTLLNATSQESESCSLSLSVAYNARLLGESGRVRASHRNHSLMLKRDESPGGVGSINDRIRVEM